MSVLAQLDHIRPDLDLTLCQLCTNGLRQPVGKQSRG